MTGGVRYQEPDFLPWDGRRVPLTLLGGYLGAGKTTVLNELLARTERPIAVLVNDVGQVNIDARLVARRSGDTIELTDGCVCCSLSDGFGAAFDQLRARTTPPEHVVVELSGVADPSRVTPWGRSAGFRLDGVVVLLDVDQFAGLDTDPMAGPVLQRQLAAADLIVLTKLDLIDPASDAIPLVRDRLTTTAPGVPVIEGAEAVATAGLLEIGGGRGVEREPAPSLFDVHDIVTRPLPDPIEVEDVGDLLDGLEGRVVRAKAISRSSDGRLWSVQVVGRRRTISELPTAEQQNPTDLVVIRLR